MTTPQDIAKLMECTSDKMVKTLIAKGTDYSGNADTFVNFKLSSSIAGVPTEKTILVRMSDKISRLGGLLDRPPMVADEGIEDTLDDLIGYCILMKGYLIEKASVEKAERIAKKSHMMMDNLDPSVVIGVGDFIPLDEEIAECNSKYANDPHVETGAD